MGAVSLASRRLELRGLGPADAPALFAYRSLPEVQRFQSFRPASLAEAEAFIRAYPAAFAPGGGWSQLGVFLEGGLIGDLGARLYGTEGLEAEIGYTIAPARQGKGYGKEAVARLLDFLFLELRARRAVASLDPKNLASAALLSGLGFRREGLFLESVLVDGAWADDLRFAILAREWEERRGAWA